MVFCNEDKNERYRENLLVTILILIDGFLQCKCFHLHLLILLVTILILIDGFLQYKMNRIRLISEFRHNPYFNRWFSAINMYVAIESPLGMSQSLF